MPKAKNVSIESLMKKQLNLYPYKNGKFSDKQRRTQIIVGLLIAISVAMLGTSLFLYKQNSDMVKEIVSRKANLQIEQGRLSNQRVLDELIKRIEYKSTLLKFIDSGNTSAALVIETIERNIPSEIKYINLDFVSDSSIRISCQTSDQQWVAKLIHQLKSENFFDNIFVESINSSKTQLGITQTPEYEFQLICTFGGKSNETQK